MKKTKGFTLLEVLVTLVIMSFGLLGIAGIIVNSLKNNQSSYARSQASWLGNDIIERMRANRGTAEIAPSPYNLALGTDPTGAGVAPDDLTQWRTALASTLPSGTGSVVLNAVTNTVTIVVQWDDSHATSGSSVQSITVETRL
ncbi:MAG: type IV pilus modification protein PilV [Undibacterium sp.]|uniref:type IV pilus modification protein PilV n=1 Tax=Undibacterium sp. TaxID=1914977 RepID=UPI002727CFFA|nr:type IV pilus modification protein PilV [Undibacterium sp.]MDO8651303.1 type IV pilus modification protein PilV [Undibacterium sp.]